MRPRSAIRFLLRYIGLIEKLFATLAAVLLISIMMIVSLDVGMRYLFNSPFSWSYDLISLYLMTALFYLAFSGTFSEGAQISVDIAQYYFPVAFRRVCQIVYSLLSAGLFLTVAWLGYLRTVEDYSSGAATAGAVLWPSWLTDVFVPLGAGLLGVRLLLHAVAHGLSLGASTPLIDLPALAGSEEGLAKGGFE
jgi:TRAP-type C4-dicarboxylate transport system permease small subunit